MSNIVRYRNGNYICMLDLDNGTKIRYNNENELIPEFPESMDILISKRCDMGCPMCHEKCTPTGAEADLMSPSFIDKLHPYTELALNGNSPLHPDLVPFLEKCKRLKLVPSLTVNQRTFVENVDLLYELCHEKLIYGLGVSLNDVNDEFIREIKRFPNAVIHVINGVTPLADFEKLAHNNLKILILGYKNFGRGVDFYHYHSLEVLCHQNDLYNELSKIIDNEWFNTVSFDNLALEQLDVKKLMSEDEWRQFFMGEDGTATMYIDMVNKQFAKSSTSTRRYDMMDNVVDMFDIIRNESDA